MIYLVTNQTSLLDIFTDVQIISVGESLNLLNKEPIIGIDTETTGFRLSFRKYISVAIRYFSVSNLIDTTTVNITNYKSILEDKNILKNWS